MYHILNRECGTWPDVLSGLRQGGLQFEAVDRRTWLEKLGKSDPDVSTNPTYKLLVRSFQSPDPPVLVWHLAEDTVELLPKQDRSGEGTSLCRLPSGPHGHGLADDRVVQTCRCWTGGALDETLETDRILGLIPLASSRHPWDGR